jgi:mannose-6-phosphate isomerase-like protein (cupin superfamily)
MPKLTPAQALARLPGPRGSRFVELFGHGTLRIEIYAPWGVDPQTPHSRDEVYFVIAGRGMFVDGPDRYPVAPGDLLLMPAGVVHRFEDFTDDFSVWVLFYGPEGGEVKGC